MLHTTSTLPPDNRYSLTKAWVKRITNPHFNIRITGSVLLVPVGSVRPGSLAHWLKRRAETVSPCSTNVPHACLMS